MFQCSLPCSGFPLPVYSYFRDNTQTCDVCGKVIKGKMGVWCHKLARHNVLATECDLPVLTCPECSKRFLRQVDYDIHMRKHVAKPDVPKPHACGECPYSAATRSALKSHKARKHRQQPENGDGDGGTGGSQGVSLDPLGEQSSSVDHQNSKLFDVDDQGAEQSGGDSTGQ
jgi:hypothetical protein